MKLRKSIEQYIKDGQKNVDGMSPEDLAELDREIASAGHEDADLSKGPPDVYSGTAEVTLPGDRRVKLK